MFFSNFLCMLCVPQINRTDATPYPNSSSAFAAAVFIFALLASPK